MVHVEAPHQGISWSGASGHPGKDTRAVLEADQPALIASNIKTYVSATILKLVEEKKLSVEYPIKDLLTKKTRTLFENGGFWGTIAIYFPELEASIAVFYPGKR